jgi:hypothetical protein
MKAYAELVRDLDSGGAQYSQDLSEVDLSDLDDLKVRVNDPAGDVLVHLGSSDYGSSEYLKRYKIYVSHTQEWRQQFQKLESVNLRYDNQVIVNPDMENAPRQAQLALAVAKAAAAAGVKPAALVSKVAAPNIDKAKALPKPAFELSKTTLDEAAGKKPSAKTKPVKAKTKAVTHPKNTAAQKKTAQKNALPKNAPKQIVRASGAPISPVATKSPAKTDDKKPVLSAPPTVATPKPSPAIAKPSATESN